MHSLLPALGLRTPHYDAFFAAKPALSLVELHSENHMAEGGTGRSIVGDIAAIAPLSLHGVGLSLGSADGIEPGHLRKLKSLVDEFDPLLVSDHLCWSRIGEVHSHGLLPLAMNREAIDSVVANIDRVQQFLGRELLVENIATYVIPDSSDIPEYDFIAEVIEKANCGLLLDISNIFVNCHNHGLSPGDFWQTLPWQRIKEIHLGGYEYHDSLLIDAHNGFIDRKLLDQLPEILKNLTAPVPLLVEWDEELSDFDTLLSEAKTVNACYCNSNFEEACRHVVTG